MPRSLKSPEESRILLLDIETSPIISYTWGIYDQNVIKRIQTFSILTMAYKWLGGKTRVISNLPEYPTDDLITCRQIHKLLDRAEIVVAHNGASFDIRKINARFLIHKLPPPSSYKIVDTKLEAKKIAYFDSNSLNNLGIDLDEGTKIEHRGFAMWEGCLHGKRKDWADMKRYNIRDVELLERVYLRLLPYMKTHPHTTHKEKVCPKCGSERLKMNGRSMTMTGLRQRFQCQKCFGYCSWSVNSKNEILRNA